MFLCSFYVCFVNFVLVRVFYLFEFDFLDRFIFADFSRFSQKLLSRTQDNDTAMDASPKVLGLDGMCCGCSRLVRARSYLEAAGILAAHRAGISPLSLKAGSVRGIRGSQL